MEKSSAFDAEVVLPNDDKIEYFHRGINPFKITASCDEKQQLHKQIAKLR